METNWYNQKSAQWLADLVTKVYKIQEWQDLWDIKNSSDVYYKIKQDWIRNELATAKTEAELKATAKRIAEKYKDDDDKEKIEKYLWDKIQEEQVRITRWKTAYIEIPSST